MNYKYCKMEDFFRCVEPYQISWSGEIRADRTNVEVLKDENKK